MSGIFTGDIIGSAIAIIYAGLMFYAHAAQVLKIHRKQEVQDTSARFFLYSWYAMGLRALVVGVIFLETQSLSAIILGIVEVLNFLARIGIFFQIRHYQRKGNHKHHGPAEILKDMAPGRIEMHRNKEQN